jgi:hypothetical protein
MNGGISMDTKDRENEALLQTLEQREAGVTDLLEFYAGVEAIYAASIQALQDEHTAMASNTTNRE